MLDLLHDLNIERGKTIVMVLHDLNQACRYADYLVAVHKGRIAAHGLPQDVIRASMIRDVFGIECHIISDPITNTPLVVPVGRRNSTQYAAIARQEVEPVAGLL